MQFKTKIALSLSCISLISQGMQHQTRFNANVFEGTVTPPIFDVQPHQQQMIFSQLPVEPLPANVHIAIQSGIQEAMHENKALSYAIFMQHLKKNPLAAEYISSVMSPIMEIMADALNGGDIEKLIALKNMTVGVFKSPKLNAIVNDELQKKVDALIESMVHIKHDKVVFSPSRHARRQMTWELNQYKIG